jgi:hypothetical protein
MPTMKGMVDMSKGQITLKVSEDDFYVACLSLPEHPGSEVSGCVKKQLR